LGLSATRGIAFQDPCGGSVFAIDGDCIGGPCPRGLDRYPVEVHGDTAEIDVTQLVKGPPRGR
jgi:Rieske Fe-S protein